MWWLLVANALAGGIPLERVSYDVDVTGRLADVVVEQVFRNDSPDWIEATYVFPLQQDAAVDEMTMAIGDRQIVGVIKERGQARQEYEEAVANGQAAALTEQERPNVFTQSVGNIPPGEEISVRLHVVQPVGRIAGGYELVLPLVVGPRFIPEGVEDAARITPPVSRESTGLEVDIDVTVQSGVPIASLESLTHALHGDPKARAFVDGGLAAVTLRHLPATRDFVLRWQLEVDEPEAGVVRQGQHVLVHFEPPELPPRKDIVPRELIWVLDTSCSQSGVPLEMSKAAMQRAFDGMDARDSFMVMNFADSATSMAPAPLPATPENIAFGRQYVSSYQSGGGTNMLAGVRLAMDLPSDPERERYVVFFTDGYIGSEGQILAAIEDSRGRSKVFVFGLGGSVNRYLLDEMARSGLGTATYVTLDESPGQAVEDFLQTIDKPVLSDVSIDWGDWDVAEVYPSALPDMLAGQPLDVAARVTGGSGPVTVRGHIGSGRISWDMDVLPAKAADGHAVATTWARRRIAELERQQHWGEIPDVKQEILATSLEYGVLTQYTAFVAVERKVRNTTGEVAHVDQPLNVPDGVDFDSAVSREYTPPGDPLLTVDAPRGSRAVIALMPWGETAFLRWDPLRERWYHRFLVPRDVPDGEIAIEVWVLLADGTVERRVEWMVVDSEVDEVDATVEVLEGRTRITVFAEEPLRSLTVHPAGRRGIRRHVDLREVDDAWVHEVEMPGEYCDLELVVKDRAMNTVVQEISCSH